MHGEVEKTGHRLACCFKHKHTDLRIDRTCRAILQRELLRLPNRLLLTLTKDAAVEADAFRFANRCGCRDGNELRLRLFDRLRDESGQGVDVGHSRR